MHIPWRHHRRAEGQPLVAQDEPAPTEVSATELGRLFDPPRWLQDLGLLAWCLVGVGLVLFGTIWLLGAVSTIVVPVVTGTIAAAVAGPLVDALQRRRVPRAAGAALVLLLLLALGALVLLLVLGGIVEQGDQIKAYATQALD